VIHHALAWLAPPPKDALAACALLAWVGGVGAATLGVVALLIPVSLGRVSAPFAAAALAFALLAPTLALLGAGLANRRDDARRVARVLLPLVIRAALWLGLAVYAAPPTPRTGRKALTWGGLTALGAAWVWLTLGRPGVRAHIRDASHAPLAEALRHARVPLAFYALFLVTAVGGAVSFRTFDGAAWLDRGQRGAATIFAGLGAALVTTLGAWTAWRLWTGPEAHLDLVTPEAWRRIVELGPDHTASGIVRTLEAEAYPPPGRRWTTGVVRDVLRAVGNDPPPR
jgi:hypothetical protein